MDMDSGHLLGYYRDLERANRRLYRVVSPGMAGRLAALKAQLDKVYALMGTTGRRGHQQVVFGEGAFAELLQFLEMAPAAEGDRVDLSIIHRGRTDFGGGGVQRAGVVGQRRKRR